MRKTQKNWPKNCEFNYKLMIMTRLQETRLTYKKSFSYIPVMNKWDLKLKTHYQQSTQNFKVVKILCIIMMGIYVSFYICPNSGYTLLRVNPQVNYGLCVIRMCQCRLLSCHKCTILVRNFAKEGGFAYVAAGRI